MPGVPADRRPARDPAGVRLKELHLLKRSLVSLPGKESLSPKRQRSAADSESVFLPAAGTRSRSRTRRSRRRQCRTRPPAPLGQHTRKGTGQKKGPRSPFQRYPPFSGYYRQTFNLVPLKSSIKFYFSLAQKGGGEETRPQPTNRLGTVTDSVTDPILLISGKEFCNQTWS